MEAEELKESSKGASATQPRSCMQPASCYWQKINMMYIKVTTKLKEVLKKQGTNTSM
jgi:hypothetical protein